MHYEGLVIFISFPLSKIAKGIKQIRKFQAHEEKRNSPWPMRVLRCVLLLLTRVVQMQGRDLTNNEHLTSWLF